jgi:hypothetical protein
MNVGIDLLIVFIASQSFGTRLHGRRRRRFFFRMKNSGRQRKPYKIASRFAKDGDRRARTPDE